MISKFENVHFKASLDSFKIQIHLLLLALIIPNLGFATLIIKAPFYLILIGLSLYLIYENSFSVKNLDKLDLAVLFYLLACFISVFHSYNSIYSFGDFSIYASIVIISFYLAKKCKHHKKLKYIVDTIGLYLGIIFFISLFFIASDQAWELAAGKVRFKGIYLHPVSYGNLLLIGVIIFVGKFIRYNSPLFASFVLIMLFQLYLTGSRTPLIGLIFIIGYLYFKMADIREIRGKTRILTKAFSIPVFAAVFLVVILNNFEEILISFFTRNQGEELWAMSGRVTMWIAAFQSLIENPIVGKGFGMAGRIIIDEGIYLSPTINENPVLGIGGITHLHNAWLQASVQTNILGMLSFTMIYLLSIKKVILNFFRKQNTTTSVYRSFIIPSLLLFIILISLVTSVPSSGRDIIVFLFFLALFIKIINNKFYRVYLVQGSK